MHLSEGSAKDAYADFFEVWRLGKAYYSARYAELGNVPAAGAQLFAGSVVPWTGKTLYVVCLPVVAVVWVNNPAVSPSPPHTHLLRTPNPKPNTAPTLAVSFPPSCTRLQAFKNYDEAGSARRIQCLKYVVLASMLMEQDYINPFDSQEIKVRAYLYTHTSKQARRTLLNARAKDTNLVSEAFLVVGVRP